MNRTDVLNAIPTQTKPPDFLGFWENTLTELQQQPLSPHLSAAKQRREDIALHSVAYNSLNGTRIQGYLLRWNDDKPRPLVVYTHGYNSRCSKQYWSWAQRGAHILGFDTRGFGRSIYADLNIHPTGYLLTGLESPQTSILRGAVCDYIRAHQAALELITSSIMSTTYYGYSFSGALALMAEAVVQQADRLVVGVPTFGWMEGRRWLVRRGSGWQLHQYLLKHPEQEEQAMRTLSYFDSMNFADLLDLPTLIGLGINDDVVPAKTVYAIIDHLTCPHQVRRFPVSHSNVAAAAQWKEFHSEWLDLVEGDMKSGGA